MFNWTYSKALRAFNQSISSNAVVWDRIADSDDPFGELTAILNTEPEYRQNDLSVIAPLVSTWLRWKYERRDLTPNWHHWFLEPEMSSVFLQASIDDMPVSKATPPPGTGIRLFCYDSAGFYAEIMLAFARYEHGDTSLLLSTRIHGESDGAVIGSAACILPWNPKVEKTLGNAYSEAMGHLNTDDNNARTSLYQAMVIGISAWLYFTSTEPDSWLLEDPDYSRAERKVARMTGAAQRKAWRALGKKPQTFRVFKLRDLPVVQSTIPKENEHRGSDSVSGGNAKSKHLVRAHWRWQACGTRWSQHKLVLVKPHIRGSEDESTTGYRFRA